VFVFFFFKQKTAYEITYGDWSSDVCSSDLFLLFTLIAIVSMQMSLVAHYSAKTSVESRVEAMINFYNSLAQDVKRAMNIVSRRAVSSAVSYVVSKGTGLPQANYTIAELIINGTIDGEMQPLMNYSTIIDWKNGLEGLSRLENLDTKISIGNVTITPFDPFNIQVNFDFYVSISDKNLDINLTRRERMSTIVDITNFEDPLYPLYTYGRSVNTIIPSPHWRNYSSTDLTNLIDDLNNSYYHPSRHGASFLDRLEGKCLVQEKYKIDKDIGLESFVDKDKILTLGIPVYLNRSSVDYIYFCNIPAVAYQINGMPASFRLDNETSVLNWGHLQIYNVSERVV